MGLTYILPGMPLCFFLMFQPPLVGEENYFQLVFKPVIFLTFSLLAIIVYDCPLAGKTRHLSEIFSVI